MLVRHFIENIFRSGLILVCPNDIITNKLVIKNSTSKYTNEQDFLMDRQMEKKETR